jgi:RNA polymerase sigma-70 factor (ECF subfamily)
MTVIGIPLARCTAASDAADERSLLAGIAARDREALRKLYHAYHRRLARFLGRVTRSPELVEEIINDTMLVVWRQAAALRGDSQLSTWILGIAYRRALKALRREAPHSLSVEPDASGEQSAAPADEMLRAAELDDWLAAALAELSPEHRLTIELAYFVGLSCEELAAVMECPVGTVKTRMFHARHRLRALLESLSAPRRGPSEGVA